MKANRKKMRLYLKIKVAQGLNLARKCHKEAQKLALAVVMLEFMIAGGMYISVESKYFDEIYQKQSVVVIFKPAEARELKVADKPETDRIDELSNLIWLRESTRGKNNYSKCEAAGKINGIGYGISGNGKYICFESHKEEMRALRNWLKSKKSAGMSKKQMLCLYSGNNYKECKQGN